MIGGADPSAVVETTRSATSQPPLSRLLTVTDLHQSVALYSQLSAAVARHRPDVLALVGDFLDYGGLGRGQLSIRTCAEILAGLRVREIVLVRGNHEDRNWLTFVDAFASRGRRVNALHGEEFQLGSARLLGFPCLLGDEQWFANGRRRWPVDPAEWLPSVLARSGHLGPWLWLMHEPPAGTPLSVAVGPIAGNPEWTEAIRRFQPRLVVCGHDHATPRRAGLWHARLGETVVVNVGQPDQEVLHYAMVEVESGSSADAAAVAQARWRVLAFPWGQEIVLDSVGVPGVPAE